MFVYIETQIQIRCSRRESRVQPLLEYTGNSWYITACIEWITWITLKCMIVISDATTILLKKKSLWTRRCFYLDFVSKGPVNVFHGSHVSITFCILWTVKSCSAFLVNSCWPPAETEPRSDGIVVERRLCQVQQTAKEWPFLPSEPLNLCILCVTYA